MNTWWLHGGVNCNASGTQIDHASAGRMSLASCESLCETTSDCAGVVHRTMLYDWVHHANKNCYDGAGAEAVPLPSAASREDCYAMTLPECKSQCLLASGCTGVVWAADGGTCCARSNIRIPECATGGGTWDTYVLQPPTQTPHGDCWRRSDIDIAQCDVQVPSVCALPSLHHCHHSAAATAAG